MTLSWFVQNLLNGLSMGSVYAIFALGYTLVFSILGIINFAHGAVFTLGAYLTYILAVGHFGINGMLAGKALPFTLPFPLALLVGTVLAGLAGLLVERLAFKPLRERQADALLALVSSLGVALILVNCIQYVFGAEIYSFPQGVLGSLPAAVIFKVGGKPVIVRTVQVVLFGVSMLMLGLLVWGIHGTKSGKALLATAENPDTASLLGINVDLFIMGTFFISGLLGGLAGTLIGVSFGLAGPYFGVSYGLKGLAVIVLGGLGSIPGSVLGGLLIGLAEAFLPPDLSSFKEAVPYALLFIILLVRPQGILGGKTEQKV
ncbi:ABC-type transporter, integral membrane subunit [Desulfovibrio sp. X2]|uniref:branched-chain amino acid ABC transporter permease n=1 Tax=Desulfovibrio sp. X2 TaxID=941449 RepID=UPI000358CBB9|nr:branched-chain amino acid ABC transporter permease [Desulfovibrio sp. X2]EPR42185.1 ABC-type transporter, integral membrane subunit [Desulfovibrio sp. X2]